MVQRTKKRFRASRCPIVLRNDGRPDIKHETSRLLMKHVLGLPGATPTGRHWRPGGDNMTGRQGNWLMSERLVTVQANRPRFECWIQSGQLVFL